MAGDTSQLTKVVEQVKEQMWNRYLILKEVTAIPIGMEEITPTELRRRFPNMKSEERATVIQNIGLEKALAALRGNDGTQS